MVSFLVLLISHKDFQGRAQIQFSFQIFTSLMSFMVVFVCSFACFPSYNIIAEAAWANLKDLKLKVIGEKSELI